MQLPDRGDGFDFRIRWQPDQVDPSYIVDSDPILNQDPVFEITIIDDSIAEPPGREYFEIDLSLNPGGGNRNGFFYPRAVGRVTIIDDDTRKILYGACSPILYYYDGTTIIRATVITFCTW